MEELLDRSRLARLAERLLPTRPSENSENQIPDFPWLLIPRWLAESFGLSATAAGRTLFDDLCWIQFCVYGLFRAQDDVVDGDVGDPLLAVEANRLLVEAASRAAVHFDGASPFWTVFRDSIAATSRAMIELDRLQRSPERVPHAELDLYVDLAACLKIAAAGVAIAAGRERLWPGAISPALDRIAVAGQVLDDVQDLEEDLAAGRINYAAWCLAQPVFGSTSEATAAVVASNLATTDRLDALLVMAGGLLREAAVSIGRDLCPQTHAYLLEYSAGIAALARSIEDSRRALFDGDEPVAANEIVPTPGATSSACARTSCDRPA